MSFNLMAAVTVCSDFGDQENKQCHCLHFVVIHIVKSFRVVNEAELEIFMKFCYFPSEPMNAGNLISGSSALSKPSLYICMFSVHMLLKLILKDFEHNLISMFNEHRCMVV